MCHGKKYLGRLGVSMIHVIRHHDTQQIEVALADTNSGGSFFIDMRWLVPDTALFDDYCRFRRFRHTGAPNHIEIPIATESVRAYHELRALTIAARAVVQVTAKTISEGSVLA